MGNVVKVSGRRSRQRLKPVDLATRPVVSVVIPCFNYADYVLDAVKSALEQPGVDVEVIIVDDRSSDDSVAKVKTLAEDDSRVRLVEHDVNLGAVRTFNDGLALITGDYVVRLDADDLLTPGSLARAAAVMEATPSVGLVYGHPLHFTHALPRPRQTPRRWTVWSGAEWLRQRCRTGVNVITAPEVMMRRTVVDDVGGQRDLTHSHDMEMWLRIASVSDVAFIHGVDQAWHRKHGASLSQSVDPDFGGMNDRLEAFVELLSSPDRPIAAAAELRAMAQNALSEEALGRIIRLYDLGRHGTQVETELWRFADGLSGDGLPSARRRRAERLRESGSRSRLSVRLLRRGVIRVRTQREFARWRRKGVFHRDQI